MSKRIYVPKPGEKGFEDPIVGTPKPGTGFEVPVFKDQPEIKPVVKAPLPTVIKPDVEKP
jgi:hypothetical protein